MEYRPLGATGVQVSAQCLGAMMYGPAGNNDEAECAAMTHKALDAGINFIDTADRYSLGISEEIVGRAIKGRRDEVVLATKFYGPMGDDINMQGRLAPLGDPSGGTQSPPAGHRLHRPLSDAPARPPHRHRRHSGRAHRPGAGRKDPHDRHVHLPGRANRGGPVGRRAPQSGAGPLRAAPLLHLHPGDRAVGAPHLRGLRHGRDRVEPAQRRLAHRQVPQGRRLAGELEGHPANLVSAKRWDRDNPVVKHKLDLVEELDALAAEVGCSMAGLAYAFTLAHPAVTSTIIGPRTPQQLDAALEYPDLRLSNDVLDRIDNLVPPGTDLNPDDAFYIPPSIANSALRRI